MEELNGRVAFVTGAASGIGLAMTEAFVAEGVRVVMADIEEAPLIEHATRLDSAGADVIGLRTDVADSSSVSDAAEQTLSHFGQVDIVCNNAGVAPGGPMLETTPADWKWIVDVNILGVAHGVTTFGPLLVEQGHGHIVNTASEAGLSTTPALGMYCATKHAVVGLSEALYKEVEPQGVGVSVLCPNIVKTAIFDSERNRENHIRESEHAPTMAMLREVIDAGGIAPDLVGAAVVDAIRANQFWILTHEHTLPSALKRFEDLQAGSNPTMNVIQQFK